MEAVGFDVRVLNLMGLAARCWIAEDRNRMLRQIYTIPDTIVVLSLLITPLSRANLALLPILRGLRIIHSCHLVQDLRRSGSFFKQHEDTAIAVMPMIFFVVFAVTTLTTTGYGDIMPVMPGGKFFSVLIMAVGGALFVQLARAIIRLAMARVTCAACGLSEQDQGAVQGEHCRASFHIKTDGSL